MNYGSLTDRRAVVQAVADSALTTVPKLKGLIKRFSMEMSQSEMHQQQKIPASVFFFPCWLLFEFKR